MNTITYVVSPAANMVEIPLLAFPTAEAARTHLHTLGLVPEVKVSLGMRTRKCWVRKSDGTGFEEVESTREEWATVPDLSKNAHLTADGFSFVRVPTGHSATITSPVDGKPISGVASLEQLLDAPNGDDPTVEHIIRNLCAGGHYYSGNGGIYRLELRTLPIGTPVVAWDLD